MNYWVEKVAALLNVDQEVAQIVKDSMWIDFSEASEEQFTWWAKYQYKNYLTLISN